MFENVQSQIIIDEQIIEMDQRSYDGIAYAKKLGMTFFSSAGYDATLANEEESE